MGPLKEVLPTELQRCGTGVNKSFSSPDRDVVGLHQPDLLRLLERELQERVSGNQENLRQKNLLRKLEVTRISATEARFDGPLASL